MDIAKRIRAVNYYTEVDGYRRPDGFIIEVLNDNCEWVGLPVVDRMREPGAFYDVKRFARPAPKKAKARKPKASKKARRR
ncbi:hypothetical protein [Bradyrhizobium erythrophlei]|uniref:Uncharacterized protein n=1 Tax=Bradyrhizobium erythrophlei TaxID=1437360 RepID=A0A1M5NKK1_9BRAD|nr:hypothetical protein [Bradyrhizobium erythrophlei]SHG89987.1 hypothetical protein SAMN05443248_3029 [Bradyrhizobium erythrophlei]